MPSFLNFLNWKSYVALVVFIATIAFGIYVNYLKSDLADEKKLRIDTEAERDEANKNNELIIEAYEQTLKIEKEKNIFEITTQKEKEPLIKISEKVKQEVQNVKKYKELKQDEKECPKLGTFKL